MKYFLHDSNAFNDEKITMLHMKFGFEAVGLFFTILEKLAFQEKPIQESVLRAQLGIRKKLEKQLYFMYEIEILSVKNGEVFNENILKVSEKYQIKKEKTKKRVSDWREIQADSESVTRYERVRNSSKVNKSKVKESKVNSIESGEIVVSIETPNTPKQSLSEKMDSKKTEFKRWLWDAIQASDNLLFWTENENAQTKRFFEYWTEHSPSAVKLRWEKEKAFDLKRRLKTWEGRNDSNKPTSQGYQTAAEKTKASHDQLQRDMERRFAEKLSKM